MTRLRILSLAVALSLPGLAWAGPQYRLAVDGLACPFCSYGIEKQLHKIAGVEEIRVELEPGHVMVRMRDGAQLTEAQARTATEKAGFTLRGFKAVGPSP